MFLGRGEVAFHQRRRDLEDAGHVVEAVARAVGRKQRRDVDVEVEKVANRVPVLGPVQAVERLRSARIGSSGGCAVEPRLEPRHEGLGRRPIGAGRSRRRHETAVQLPHDLLPGLGIRADVAEVRGLQNEPARLQPLVVAGHAVLRDEGLRSGNGGGRCRRLRRRPGSQGVGGARDQGKTPHARSDRETCGPQAPCGE